MLLRSFYVTSPEIENITNMKSTVLSYVLASVFLLAACAPDPVHQDVMMDGTYEGLGEGRGGIIKVAIDVKEHTIEAARVLAQSESSFAQSSIDDMIGRVIKAQSADVDAISGATLTSEGVKSAMKMAIDKAYGRFSGYETFADTQTDVVVIGAGGAGLSAAIEAGVQGAGVIVLEKRDFIGGNTNSSTGGINGAETSFQKALGIEDSKELFYDDIMKGGHYLNDPALVRTLVENAPATLDWIARMGADLTDVGLMGGSSVKRTHRPKGGLAIGPHLIKVLYDEAMAGGVDIRTGNTVQDILMSSDGKACGVRVSQNEGPDYTIKAKAVIIATGGFGANLSMVTSYCPELAGFSTVNHKGATGDAFSWVKKFGAELYQMDKIQTHPTVDVKNSLMITEAVRGNGAILLNRDGKRFVNEMDTRDVVSEAILSQEKGTAFLFFDQAVRESLSAIENYDKLGLMVQSPDLAGIASKTGMDEAALSQSLQRYNGFQSCGEDTDYHRSEVQMPVPLARAPYYAVEVKPAIHHTMGGIHIDSMARVLDEEGQPVEGLFACGEVTGGVHGGNRLGGNGVADIVVFGRIAGREASKEMR